MDNVISRTRSCWTFNVATVLRRKMPTSKVNTADANDRTTYTWDSPQRLTQVSTPEHTATYQYDLLGRRVQRQITKPGFPPETTHYVYDGLQAVGEIRPQQSSTSLMTGLNLDEMLARVTTLNATNTTQARTYLTDALGSVIAQTQDNQSTLAGYSYSPYGQTQSTGNTEGDSVQYTGRENDNNGLYYYRARYYDPVLKRFLSEDPIGLSGGSLSFYAYVNGNPVSYIDPLGLASCTFTMSTGRLVCTPSNPQNNPVNIPVASGNNGGGQQCRNNPACTAIPNRGPIPTGCWQWTNGTTSRPNGRVLVPCPGTSTNASENRTLIRSHSCANPFGPGLGPQYCSEGCVTGTAPDIQRLNRLIDAESGSILQVVP
jgi:RHS repeat-associated protein